MTLILLLLTPLASVAILPALRRRFVMEVVQVAAAGVILVLGILVSASVWSNRAALTVDFPVRWLDGILRVDALSALLIVLIVFVGFVGAFYSVGYLRSHSRDLPVRRLHLYFSLFNLFLFSMLLAVSTDNLGVMWVAIEGTSLTTAFLVNMDGTGSSIEAGYKYLILSSVGIAMAFLGTVLIYSAGLNVAGEVAANRTSLLGTSASLNPEIVRLAFILVLVGYGTKAGLAPMHTWLPDAHSEAPAPVSSLMSGVLTSVGFYAILRFKVLADLVLGTSFSEQLLTAAGIFSLALAAVFLLQPANYKRMLAYSTVEHMGLITLAVGFGGYWGVFGALFQLINHSLSKSLLFIVSGNIFLKFHSTRIADVKGLLRVSPWTGGAFLAGLVALMGLPPSATFLSELMIFKAGIDRGSPVLVACALGLLVAIFGGMLGAANKMLCGQPPESVDASGEPLWAMAPLSISLAILLVLGLVLPAPLLDLFDQALQVLGV